MTPKISIVIPIYNVAEYLIECIGSCICDHETSIEVICINDGSTDNSLEIVEKLAQADPRVKVYTQENKGLGASRNIGVELAIGEYILFLDADDWIEPGSLLQISEKIDQFKPEIILAQSYMRKENKITAIFPEEIFVSDSVMSGLEYTAVAKDYLGVVWDKIWERSFLIENNLKCHENAYFEDIPVSVPGIILASKVIGTNICFYNYRIRNNSMSNQRPPKKQLVDFYNNRILFLKKTIKENNTGGHNCFKKMLIRSIVDFLKKVIFYPKFDLFKIKNLFIALALCLQYPLGVTVYLKNHFNKKVYDAN